MNIKFSGCIHLDDSIMVFCLKPLFTVTTYYESYSKPVKSVQDIDILHRFDGFCGE